MKNYIIMLLLIMLAASSIIHFGLRKKVTGPVSFEEKADVALYSSVNLQKNTNIFWTARSLTLISNNGKLKEVQVGLDTNGFFRWREVYGNGNEYKY